jgi:hypothetical protein
MVEEMNYQIHLWMKLCFKQFIRQFVHEQRNAVMNRFMKKTVYDACHQLNSAFVNQ